LKHTIKYFLFGLTVILLQLNSFGQNIDSLKLALKNAKHDTTRLNLYKEIGRNYNQTKDYRKALETYKKGLSLSVLKNNKRYIVDFLFVIGNMYSAQDNYDEALNNYQKSLLIARELKDTNTILEIQISIGNTYSNSKNNVKAFEHFQMALQGSKEKRDTFNIRNVYNMIGFMFQSAKNFKNAEENFKKALEISEFRNEKWWIRGILANIGNLYLEKGEYQKSIEITNRVLKMAIDQKDEYSIALSFGSLAEANFKLNNLKKAKEFAKLYLNPSVLTGVQSDIMYAELLTSKIDSAIGDTYGAYEHYKQYIFLKDKLNSEDVKKSAIKSTFQSEYELQKAIDAAKRNNEIEIEKNESKNQRIITISISIALILLAIITIIIFRSLNITRKQKKIIELKEIETQKQNEIILLQKHLVEEKHKEITDSLNYAERIQRSFLATKEILDENLNDYFVLFKPKEVVSGDFYWASILNNGNFALVTADSTGHGVPGAIMSLLNITSLEKAVEHLNNPSEIFDYTRANIISRLKKDGSETGGKDGMDASLLVFDFKQKQVHIAAANNPVWIFRKRNADSYELIEVKPDKMPIGKHDKDTIPFTQQTISLNSGDVIYTITDGYPDQFGGEKGKKFMIKNFKELLKANAHLPMQTQKELLDHTFNNWVGNLEQVDDVTIIGVRI